MTENRLCRYLRKLRKEFIVTTKDLPKLTSEDVGFKPQEIKEPVHFDVKRHKDCLDITIGRDYRMVKTVRVNGIIYKREL